jgi:hypothetical protein
MVVKLAGCMKDICACCGTGGKRTQTLKLRFLYVTDSTLNPIVGIVVTTSPICSVRLAFAIFLELWRSAILPSVCIVVLSCLHCPALVISIPLCVSFAGSWLVQVRESVSASLSSPI